MAASLHLLPGIWKDVHWRSLAPFTLGCLLATPFGVYLLANIPAAPMQIAMAGFVLTATLLLWQGFALKTMPEASRFDGGWSRLGIRQWRLWHRWTAGDPVLESF